MTTHTPDTHRSGRRSKARDVAVVVASVGHDATPALASLARFADEVRGRGEVVLVHRSRDEAPGPIARRARGVRAIESPTGALAPELWRDGLDATDAPVVALSTTAMVPAPGWLDAMLGRLDATGAAVVGGPIEPADDLSATDRAVYLLRYVSYLRPLLNPAIEPPGENAVYRRERLRGLEATISEGFWESEIHRRLRERGERWAMAENAASTFHGGGRLGSALISRFRHARRYGSTRGAALGLSTRLARALAAPAVPAVLLGRIGRALKRRGRPFGPWAPALPALAALLTVWASGEALGMAFSGQGGTRNRDAFETLRTTAWEGLE